MLRVNDLKQYDYCPRVVYYQYVMPVERAATFKMAHGKSAEARIDTLEQRRTTRRYGLPDGQRHFHVWLTSDVLGLSGKLDLVIESSSGWYPVDFKETTGPVRSNHLVQLCGYALLVEEAYRCSVTQGFIYLIPGDRVEPVDLTDQLKTDTLIALDRIREMIVLQRVPNATEVQARCADCEYRNYCGDVF
ncbi:MAG: CRISPR-associated protein Cas4 [Gaiellales bacterium]|nr:MAG: CRISPR-associated protein Cas4 [Gaiellales bacterium]